MYHVFGPVPSRRLGRSMGINNIPPKACTYSCVYCQLGRSNRMQCQRRPFLDPQTISDEAAEKVKRTREAGEPIDYLTLVADGEPTLDAHLGELIALLRPLGIKIAVLTNASLTWREDVRETLAQADWVSLKVDAVEEAIWRRIDRPHRSLQLERIRAGMMAFAQSFQGELATETMLVRDLNDGKSTCEELATFLAHLTPATAYLSVPTRPPAEPWVQAPSEERLGRAYRILAQRLERVELLTGYEGNAFASTGNAHDDLLSITAVHPMQRQAVDALLARNGADWSVVEALIAEQKLVELHHDGARFYLRKLGTRHG